MRGTEVEISGINLGALLYVKSVIFAQRLTILHDRKLSATMFKRVPDNHKHHRQTFVFICNMICIPLILSQMKKEFGRRGKRLLHCQYDLVQPKNCAGLVFDIFWKNRTDGNHGYLYKCQNRRQVVVLFYFILLTLPVKLAEHHNSLRQLLWPLFYPPNHDTQQKTDHNTGNYVPYS